MVLARCQWSMLFSALAWPLVIGSGGCGLLHGACARAALRSRWRGSSRYHFRSLSTCCAVVKLAVPAAFDVGGSSGLNIVAPSFANDGNGPPIPAGSRSRGHVVTVLGVIKPPCPQGVNFTGEAGFAGQPKPGTIWGTCWMLNRMLDAPFRDASRTMGYRMVWVDGREQAESSQTPPISNECRLACVSVSGAPGGRLCFAFFFYYSSAAGVGVVSPCVGLGLACLSSSWRLQTRAGRNGVPVAISPTGSEMTVGD
ncbi:hypothetical protein B0J15DRAFT_458932 [Fusarium solani]|uniref:Uncharacterized protein n=1 Tax=Fusarium solani TaxID=169388 RepID=A0A9P9L4K1_FUSSL|nr:uncharacterized protein B0J15DRAFT_458932 [Fusarium solani]KAH7273851.1 hypothetical protein B0J15DRAFT_458932 [Fusarium solani]